ncbi:hypothetical protein [Deferrisoma camini]|uniref:hypothetical protein n=1 Tax=Deferrisoma camini TaxID=1035120 RepID=UPI00046CEA5A|nr:hypothetical protein [Deferrisoma camini]
MSRATTVLATIKGFQGIPLLMHNARLSNPLDPLVKKIKGYTAKRKKTDSDIAEIMRLEYLGGLYWDEQKGPYIPSTWIEGAIRDGAKRNRLGKAVTAGVICMADAPLEYDGPRDPDALYADQRFVSRMMVMVQRNRTLRTRPMFPEWRATFELQIFSDVIDVSVVHNALMEAGLYVGIGEYRPKYGRFEVIEWAQ